MGIGVRAGTSVSKSTHQIDTKKSEGEEEEGKEETQRYSSFVFNKNSSPALPAFLITSMLSFCFLSWC